MFKKYLIVTKERAKKPSNVISYFLHVPKLRFFFFDWTTILAKNEKITLEFTKIQLLKYLDLINKAYRLVLNRPVQHSSRPFSFRNCYK